MNDARTPNESERPLTPPFSPSEGERVAEGRVRGKSQRFNARPSVLLLLSTTAFAQETNLKPDEQIVFYPSVAQRVPGESNVWRTEIRGSIFESEKRSLMVGAFREALELKTGGMTSAEETLFNARARLFLVDHERGKNVFIRIGTNEYFVGKSEADGRFAAQLVLPDSTTTTFTAILKSGDARVFNGQIFPLENEGVSVISDIDDTIKITEVRDKQATLRNTFLREFQPVPGMAEFYQKIARTGFAPLNRSSRRDEARSVSGEESQSLLTSAATRFEGGVAFHYISASPWQLYEPLAAFVVSNGFPEGTFELKEFRWKDRSFFSLFGDPEKYKSGIIEPLLKQFPKRSFILLGDSGERDPEIYGTLARKFPEQIRHIYIRDVTNEPADSVRYQEAFRDVPVAKWQVFREPGEIEVASE